MMGMKKNKESHSGLQSTLQVPTAAAESTDQKKVKERDNRNSQGADMPMLQKPESEHNPCRGSQDTVNQCTGSDSCDLYFRRQDDRRQPTRNPMLKTRARKARKARKVMKI